MWVVGSQTPSTRTVILIYHMEDKMANQINASSVGTKAYNEAKARGFSERKCQKAKTVAKNLYLKKEKGGGTNIGKLKAKRAFKQTEEYKAQSIQKQQEAAWNQYRANINKLPTEDQAWDKIQEETKIQVKKDQGEKSRTLKANKKEALKKDTLNLKAMIPIKRTIRVKEEDLRMREAPKPTFTGRKMDIPVLDKKSDTRVLDEESESNRLEALSMANFQKALKEIEAKKEAKKQLKTQADAKAKQDRLDHKFGLKKNSEIKTEVESGGFTMAEIFGNINLS